MAKKHACTMCKATREDVKIDLDPRNPHEHKPICPDCIEVLKSVDYSLDRINAFIEYQKKWAD